MIDIDLRTAAMLALFAPFAVGLALAQTEHPDKMLDLGQGTVRDMSKVPWS